MARLTRTLLAAAGLVSSAAGQNQTQGEGLHSLMVAAGKLYFGTAMETNNFQDDAYQAISNNRNEFGMFTPENSQKWEVTQPQEGEFSFTQADAVAQKVFSNGQLLRCHTLTWHSQLPSFVREGTWTPATLTAVLTTHITNVMTHYAGQCYAWDVVNEALNEDGSLRESVFLTTLGESYIPLSFSIAAAADPDTRLYYNDFNLETTPAKAAGALQIVRLVQDAGERIDGVGFQAHLNVGQTPSRAEMAAVLGEFAELGVEVAYTELDVAHTSLPSSEADREQQAVDYVAAVGSCLDVEACVGVTVWQFTDLYSWVPNTFPGKGEACLYTEGYEKKPAYEAVLELLREAAAANGGGDVEEGEGDDEDEGDDGGEGGVGGGGSNSTVGVAWPSATASGPVRAATPFTGASAVMGGLVGLVWPAVAALLLL